MTYNCFHSRSLSGYSGCFIAVTILRFRIPYQQRWHHNYRKIFRRSCWRNYPRRNWL